MKIQANATKKLLNNPSIKNKILYFFCLPYDLFDNKFENLFWTLLKHDSVKIYYDLSINSIPTSIYINNIPRWKTILSKYYKKRFIDNNLVEIQKIGNKLKIKSLNTNKLCFKQNTKTNNLGKIKINKFEKINNLKKITDFSIQLTQKHKNKNILFITWDYKNSEFKIL